MKKTLTAAALAFVATTGAETAAEAAPPQNHTRSAPPVKDTTAPKAKHDKAMAKLFPKAPKGYSGPKDVAVRTVDDIFEQINGGSESFIGNGMTDAVFAKYPKKGGKAGTELQVEVYRFKDAAGAGKQFDGLLGEPGKPLLGGRAVVHDYGTEAVVGRYILRSTFADGPTESRAATTAIATELAPKLTN
jgi:hypothetical protein